MEHVKTIYLPVYMIRTESMFLIVGLQKGRSETRIRCLHAHNMTANINRILVVSGETDFNSLQVKIKPVYLCLSYPSPLCHLFMLCSLYVGRRLSLCVCVCV